MGLDGIVQGDQVRRAPKKVKHVSIDARRRQFSVREEGLSRLWEYENVPRRWLNHGYGILQNLMFEGRGPGVLDTRRCRHVIRNREAAIVATVIQWLGTSVGFCFLERALKMFGKKIVDIEPGSHTSWVLNAQRRPSASGRYLVRERFRSKYVSSSSSEATFLRGVLPGNTGLWTGAMGRTIEVEYWYEPEALK